MGKVMDIVQNHLQKQFTGKKGLKTASTFEESKDDSTAGFGNVQKKKEELKEKMGPSIFNYYYEFLF